MDADVAAATAAALKPALEALLHCPVALGAPKRLTPQQVAAAASGRVGEVFTAPESSAPLLAGAAVAAPAQFGGGPDAQQAGGSPELTEEEELARQAHDDHHWQSAPACQRPLTSRDTIAVKDVTGRTWWVAPPCLNALPKRTRAPREQPQAHARLAHQQTPATTGAGRTA